MNEIRRATTALLIEPDGRFWLARSLKPGRTCGWLVSPGGHIEPSDITSVPDNPRLSEINAIRRELIEETGLAVEPLRFVYLDELVHTYSDMSKCSVSMWYVRLLGGEVPANHEPEKQSSWELFTIEELCSPFLAEQLSPATKTAVSLYAIRFPACATCGAAAYEVMHSSKRHDICPSCLRYNVSYPDPDDPQ